ncbi:hypothetical protein THAOC_13443 [Thalassiosira oceanica]|uniref:Uncharacterized protein n=1 Tax=Thalassiosira oceanica TaxID=159749 RepID=K0SXH3_THAOC|nr:hypothetical protein THAOC_13443 [Thalassiosira oceanica]|eukprot:EJK65676.1 hypothetical protein THAOC_13443 [Thalassiosira oceanica]
MALRRNHGSSSSYSPPPAVPPPPPRAIATLSNSAQPCTSAPAPFAVSTKTSYSTSGDAWITQLVVHANMAPFIAGLPIRPGLRSSYARPIDWRGYVDISTPTAAAIADETCGLVRTVAAPRIIVAAAIDVCTFHCRRSESTGAALNGYMAVHIRPRTNPNRFGMNWTRFFIHRAIQEGTNRSDDKRESTRTVAPDEPSRPRAPTNGQRRHLDRTVRRVGPSSPALRDCGEEHGGRTRERDDRQEGAKCIEQRDPVRGHRVAPSLEPEILDSGCRVTAESDTSYDPTSKLLKSIPDENYGRPSPSTFIRAATSASPLAHRTLLQPLASFFTLICLHFTAFGIHGRPSSFTLASSCQHCQQSLRATQG